MTSEVLMRDFVVRLGENGLTPDVLFISRERFPNAAIPIS